MKAERRVDRAADEDVAPPRHQAPGKRTRSADLPVVQRRAARGSETEDIATAAQGGIDGASEQLPFCSQIQASFGRHDITQVRSRVGGAAKEAGDAIGAVAYAMGDGVAFSQSPDLHTAAHEAAHVVQQRAGVSLKGGVGQIGDAYERHADRVADLVVGGQSAEAALDEMAGEGGGSPTQSVVQRRVGEAVLTGSGQYEWHAIYDDDTGALEAFVCIGSPEGKRDREGELVTEQSDPAEWFVLSEKRTDAAMPWTDGPRSKRKSQQTRLSTFLGWLREFEAAYGTSAQSIQRLRRLYYSDATGGAGTRFDGLIATDEANRVTCPPLSRAALDGLFATDEIATPDGDVADLSHVFCLFDFLLNGGSLLSTSPGVVADAAVPLQGIFTWTGDLASWFVEWLDGNEFSEEAGRVDPEEAEHTSHKSEKDHVDRDAQSLDEQIADLEALKDRKVSKTDLLGDIDAHALKAKVGNIDQGATTMSAVLESYYSTSSESGVDRRYHRFVTSAVPEIPFELVSANPLTVRLGGNAAAQIQDAIHSAVCALRQTPVFALDGHAEVLAHIATRFVEFLSEGLATGKATW